MKKITFFGISLLLLLGANLPLHASVPLQEKDIQSFLTAMPLLHKLEKKYNLGEYLNTAPLSGPEEDFSPMTRSLAKMRDHAAYDEFSDIVTNAGFPSPSAWASTGDRILKTYMSIRMAEETSPAKRQALLENIAEVEKNDFLSPTMKKQMLAGMKMGLAMMTTPSTEMKADQKTLRPHLTKLEKIFKDTE